MLLFFAKSGFSQTNLSPKWEELTGPDFIQAIHQSQGVCVLPFGILEKHGPHLPIGTDLLDVRFAVMNAVKQEYAVVFPEYYFGQIFEARHQPGTVAYSLSTQLTLLQETVSEMARNGCKKIVIVNGHGGNKSLLPLFAQSQMASPRDYVVYVFGLPNENVPGRPALKTPFDMHARRSGDLEHAHRAARPGSPRSRHPAIGRGPEARPSSRLASTPASGGMRASPITTQARVRRPTRNWASSTRKNGRARSPRPSKPSKPTPPASSCKTSSTRSRSTRWTRSSNKVGRFC